MDPWPSTFLPSKKKKWKQKKKKRVQAIIGHLEFKNNSCRQTVVANNFFQCFMAPPLWNYFCRPYTMTWYCLIQNFLTRKCTKNVEKLKKHARKFLALSIDDTKTGKRKKENTAIFTQQTKRPATLLKRDSNTSAFLWNFRNF